MLPNIYGSLAENAAKTDLQAEGFTPSLFSGVAGGSGGGANGFSLPTVVGPHHYYSAHANAEESISPTELYNLRTANASLDAAELDSAEARELVVLAVGETYLRLLVSKSNVMAEEGEAKQAEASYKQTAAESDAGVKRSSTTRTERSLIKLKKWANDERRGYFDIPDGWTCSFRPTAVSSVPIHAPSDDSRGNG